MKNFSNCQPQVVNRDILATNDYEFMDRSRIKEQCVCVNKQTCLAIVDLFSNKKYEEAFKLLQTINGEK